MQHCFIELVWKWLQSVLDKFTLCVPVYLLAQVKSCFSPLCLFIYFYFAPSQTEKCWPPYHMYYRSSCSFLFLLPPSYFFFSFSPFSASCWFGCTLLLKPEWAEADKTWDWECRGKMMEECWRRGLLIQLDRRKPHRGERLYISCCFPSIYFSPPLFLL